MKNVNAKLKGLLLAAMVIALMSVTVSCSTSSSLSAGAKSWEADTVLVSPQGDQTVVRSFREKKILFKNSDAQLAIEWGLANARTTVVLAGKYVVSDRIDIPRDDVTLIIDQGAEIVPNPDATGHTYIGFRPEGSWNCLCMVYNRGHDNVRVISFGTIPSWSRRPPKGQEWTRKNPKGKPGSMMWPIFFDGRNDKRTCGIKGGMLLTTGSIDQTLWLVDSSEIQVPIMAHKFGGDGPLVLEGCDDCKLGMLVNLASTPGGKTGEVVDLNGLNMGITIERAIGERPNEVIDCGNSHATADEVVSIGEPQKLLAQGVGNGYWRYSTNKRSVRTVSLDVEKKTILTDAVDVILKNEVPKLPDALPRFTVKSTVEVTLKDGSKKVYTKEVVVDVRTGGFKPEKTE